VTTTTEAPKSVPAPGPSPETPAAPDWSKLLDTKDTPALKEQVKSATLESLGKLAKLIVERDKATVDGDILLSIRERHEQLRQDKEYDKKLSELESRLYLAQLLNIKAPAKEEASFLDTVIAQPLNWLGSMTKDFKWLSWVNDMVGNIRGRDIERMIYAGLSVPQHLPDLGWLGSPLQWVGKYAARKAMDMDIRQAISLEALAGEQIVFKDLTNEELDQIQGYIKKKKDAGTSVTVQELTMNYINSVRTEQRFHGKFNPIEITAANITNPEGRKSVTDALEKDRNEKLAKERSLKRWQDVLKGVSITSLTTGTETVAKKEEKGWAVTVREGDISKDTGDATSPQAKSIQEGLKVFGADADIVSLTIDQNAGAKKESVGWTVRMQGVDTAANAQAQKLRESMQKLKEAKEIVFVGSDQPLTVGVKSKIVQVPSDMNIEDSHVFALTNVSDRRIESIIFDRGNDIPTDKLWARFEKGKITMGSHVDWVAGTRNIASIYPHLSAAKAGDMFEFVNGSWMPERKGMPVTTPIAMPAPTAAPTPAPVPPTAPMAAPATQPS
jgi:hypothetical protein